jgi:plasmid stabilization system protein ParE
VNTPSYHVAYGDPAEGDIDAAYQSIASRASLSAAELWLTRLTQALEQRAADHAAVPGRRYVAPEAASFPGRDMRVLRLPGASARAGWRVLYELVDGDGNGQEDTLIVAYVRHGSRPISPDAGQTGQES